MIFSRNKIEESIRNKAIKIVPFSAESLKEASYTLHLALPIENKIISPEEFLVVQTLEKITLSNHIACFITTPGSVARQGIDTVQSDIFCEPGTDQYLSLQLTNASQIPIELTHGMKIAKAIFVAVE